MKNILLLIPLLSLCCSTTDITVNNNALNSVKVIALIPFTSSYTVDPLIYKESENTLASAFTRLGYNVLDLSSGTPKESENRLNLQGNTITKIKSEAIASGAHALLYGKIIFHEETTRHVFNHKPLIFRRYSLFDPDDRIKTITEFKFQIHIRLVSLSDNSIILELKNRYPGTEHDEYLPALTSLEAYRKYTLKKITDELAEKLNSRKQKNSN